MPGSPDAPPFRNHTGLSRPASHLPDLRTPPERLRLQRQRGQNSQWSGRALGMTMARKENSPGTQWVVYTKGNRFPAFPCGPKLFCLACPRVGWSPGPRRWEVQRERREGGGISSSLMLGLPSPPPSSPAAPPSLGSSTARTSSRIRCLVPNRRRGRRMTSPPPSAIGWAAPAGRTLSPVARKLTLSSSEAMRPLEGVKFGRGGNVWTFPSPGD